jgi:hypothetical protein
MFAESNALIRTLRGSQLNQRLDTHALIGFSLNQHLPSPHIPQLLQVVHGS